MNNPLGLNGIEFVEFSSPDPDRLHRLFLEFGFSRVMTNETTQTDLYTQNSIRFLLNRSGKGFAGSFSKAHGPSICSMAWHFSNPVQALVLAQKRGASAATKTDYSLNGKPIPAIFGIGESLLYFVQPSDNPKDLSLYLSMGFSPLPHPELVPQKGFLAIDHLTNNVGKGEMQKWASFYKEIFGFTEVRYFDINGAKTGLQSYALQSPCKSFCIPINEAKDAKSQINEYLEEYKGPGVQHLAFLKDNIVQSLASLKGTSIQTLDIDDQYYREVFDRVPNVTEDRKVLKDYQILVDGDDKGYLLQIFTKNLVGPIFIEIIQRKNHYSFGEGNFGALFRSIERDQMKRGYL